MKKISTLHNNIKLKKKKLGLFKNIFLEQFINRFMFVGNKVKSDFFFSDCVYLLQFFIKARFKSFLYLIVDYNLSPNKLVSKRVRKDVKLVPLIVSFHSNAKSVVKLLLHGLKSSVSFFITKTFKFLLALFNNINWKGFLHETVLSYNKNIVSNKKYLNYRW